MWSSYLGRVLLLVTRASVFPSNISNTIINRNWNRDIVTTNDYIILNNKEFLNSSSPWCIPHEKMMLSFYPYTSQNTPARITISSHSPRPNHIILILSTPLYYHELPSTTDHLYSNHNHQQSHRSHRSQHTSSRQVRNPSPPPHPPSMPPRKRLCPKIHQDTHLAEPRHSRLPQRQISMLIFQCHSLPYSHTNIQWSHHSSW